MTNEEFQKLVLTQLENIGGKLAEHDSKFDKIDKRFDKIDSRLDEHDKRFDKIDSRLDEHDKRFDKIDRRLDEHDARLERIENRLNEHDDYLKAIIHNQEFTNAEIAALKSTTASAEALQQLSTKVDSIIECLSQQGAATLRLVK